MQEILALPDTQALDITCVNRNYKLLRPLLSSSQVMQRFYIPITYISDALNLKRLTC
jgi:hypothetical protein